MQTIKILVRILFSVFSTLVMTANKMSMCLIFASKDENYTTWSASIFVVLLLPEAIGLTKLYWNSSLLFKRKHRWPSWRQTLTGLTSSVLEAWVLVYLTMEICPKLPMYITILLPQVIISLKLLLDLALEIKARRCKSEKEDVSESGWISFPRHTQKLAGRGAFLFVHLTIFVAILFSCYKVGFVGAKTVAIYGSCLIILTLLWYPAVQRYQLNSLNNSFDMSDEEDSVVSDFIFCMARMSSSATFIVLIHYTERKEFLLSGIFDQTITSNNLPILLITFVYFLTAILCVVITHLSTLSTETVSGIIIPSCASGLLSSALLVMLCIVAPVCHRKDNQNLSFVILGFSAFIWACPYVVLRLEFAPSAKTLLIPANKCFFRPVLQCLFYDQYFYCNYKPPNTTANNKARTHIFICTTMYKEDEHEMSRLLQSLQRIDRSERLRQITLESHIFLDGASFEGQIQEFGLQLLSLVESTLDLDLKECSAEKTPYGYQFGWIMQSMPLFIHLKDTALVKAGKRWSQIMYMDYVSKFRVKPKMKPRSFLTDETQVMERLVTKGRVQQTGLKRDAHRQSFDFLGGTYHFSTSLRGVPKGDPFSPIRESEKFTPNVTPSCSIDSIDSIDNIESEVYTDVQDCTYILATDADISFEDKSVLAVLSVCTSDYNVGGCCGYTAPTANVRGYLAWMQTFDYAFSFWFAKASENIFGSVMCLPGCFSLYRVKALANVVGAYASPVTTPAQEFFKNFGEDRWLCTLLSNDGWKLRYTYDGLNTTNTPNSYSELFKQRRRWILSDYMNSIEIIRNLWSMTHKNKCYTLSFAIYLLIRTMIRIINPSMVIVLLSIIISNITEMPLQLSIAHYSAVCVIYPLTCCFLASKDQIKLSCLVTLVFGILWTLAVLTFYILVIVTFVNRDQSSSSWSNISAYAMFFFFGCVFIAAVIHPSTLHILPLGLLYFAFLPTAYFTQPMYAVANITDRSWGTRDEQKANVPKCFKLPAFTFFKKKKKSDPEKKKTQRVKRCHTMKNYREEIFWSDLVRKVVGVSANTGLSKEEIRMGLSRFRTRVMTGLIALSLAWILLSTQAVNHPAIYMACVGSIYGYVFVIQTLGMVMFRAETCFRKLVVSLNGDKPVFITPRAPMNC